MKAAVIKHLCDCHNEATAAATHAWAEIGIQIVCTQLHAVSVHKLLYSNQTSFIHSAICKVSAVGTADVVDMVDAADAVCAACGGHGGCSRHGRRGEHGRQGGLADVVDLWTWWTCGCGGLVDMVDLWTQWNWWTVDAIKELGMERKDRGCVVVT